MSKGRSKPVSERDAGSQGSGDDDIGAVLAGETPPDGPETPPVEAVASGPEAQPMPGSASDREMPHEPEPPAARTDLRSLAPKKSIPEKRDPIRMAVKPGASALDKVIARGINPGNTKSVEPVETFLVTKGGRVLIGGRLATVSEGQSVTRLTHNLEELRRQGIALELVARR